MQGKIVSDYPVWCL